MRAQLFGIILVCAVQGSLAADDSVFGTHWVKFQPIQVGGELQGCELVFLTVAVDRDNEHVAVNGSIVVQATDKGLWLMLKIGLKDLKTIGSSFERPTFAYLQSTNASTSKAQQQSSDGDPGYKLFVYDATDASAFETLKELMSTRKVSIGYNRRPGGIDVLVPLDITVVDSEYTKGQKVLRKRSLDVAQGFNKCQAKMIDRVLEKVK